MLNTRHWMPVMLIPGPKNGGPVIINLKQLEPYHLTSSETISQIPGNLHQGRDEPGKGNHIAWLFTVERRGNRDHIERKQTDLPGIRHSTIPTIINVKHASGKMSLLVYAQR